jgi:phosphoenolpyruvate synthase/pyruvate phosphate dikinase
VPTAEARRQFEGEVLTGTGTSAGLVTAMARLVHGLEELEQLGRGEILVAHATMPAWTPPFALVGGLVTDLEERSPTVLSSPVSMASRR